MRTPRHGTPIRICRCWTNASRQVIISIVFSPIIAHRWPALDLPAYKMGKRARARRRQTTDCLLHESIHCFDCVFLFDTTAMLAVCDCFFLDLRCKRIYRKSSGDQPEIEEKLAFLLSLSTRPDNCASFPVSLGLNNPHDYFTYEKFVKTPRPTARPLNTGYFTGKRPHQPRIPGEHKKQPLMHR